MNESIHPLTPRMMSVYVLCESLPDVRAAVAFLPQIWGITPEFLGEETVGGAAAAGTTEPGTAASAGMPAAGAPATVLRYATPEAQFLISPIDAPLEHEGMAFPPHAAHVAITVLATTPTPSTSTPFTPEEFAIRARAAKLAAVQVLTELLDAFARFPSVIGVFRPDMGVVIPANTIQQLAADLAEGYAPTPLWVNVRSYFAEEDGAKVAISRTLGLPEFGHCDLERVTPIGSYLATERADLAQRDITAAEDSLRALATYLITSSTHLLPFHTVELGGKNYGLRQEVSPADGVGVLRVEADR